MWGAVVEWFLHMLRLTPLGWHLSWHPSPLREPWTRPGLSQHNVARPQSPLWRACRKVLPEAVSRVCVSFCSAGFAEPPLLQATDGTLFLSDQ